MPHSFLSWDKSSLWNSSILRVHWISPSVACPGSSGYLRAPIESPVSRRQSGILYTWATYVPVHGNGTILQHAEQMLPQPRRGSLMHQESALPLISHDAAFSPLLWYFPYFVLWHSLFEVSLLDWNLLEAPGKLRPLLSPYSAPGTFPLSSV